MTDAEIELLADYLTAAENPWPRGFGPPVARRFISTVVVLAAVLPKRLNLAEDATLVGPDSDVIKAAIRLGTHSTQAMRGQVASIRAERQRQRENAFGPDA